MAGYTNGPAWVTGGGVEGEALKALGEARAAYAELELRLVEAEAVIQAVAEITRRPLDPTKVLDNPAGRALWKAWLLADVARAIEDAPSVVLADHDAAAWDQGFVASENHKGVVAMEGQPWRVTTPVNPYRGDNR